MKDKLQREIQDQPQLKVKNIDQLNYKLTQYRQSQSQISQNRPARLADSAQELTTIVIKNNTEIIYSIHSIPVVTKKNHSFLSKKPIHEIPPKEIISKKDDSIYKEAVVIQSIVDPDDFEVYRLGDQYFGTRVLMKNIGIDIGTKTVVVAYKGENNKTGFISEINGYWIFERSSPFIENMLNDPNRKRADGTVRPARWIKLPDTDKICVLGRDAEEFAYAKNDTLLRPMAEGGITPDEESMTVLASIVQGLLEMAENEIGKFTDDIKICYCTTAPALNKSSNISYHEKVINLIINGYETKSKISTYPIKESHAIVIDMSPDATGIGISWGAGTVTVSFIKYGLEVYSFCWVGAGDWIDQEVAIRHGYDPDMYKTRRKTAKETPTTVCKRKHDVDLTPGKEPTDRVGMDIVLHYDVLIDQVVSGIVQGFIEHEAEARIEQPINIYMAGGTASPKGFEDRVASKFDEKCPPFEIAKIIKSNKPLYAVAEGCLKACELM